MEITLSAAGISVEEVIDREVASMFRLLQRAGVSQRQIAALTGQSQSEVSEILAGRQVRNVDVLRRIANGIGFSPTVFGLAAEHDDKPITVRISAGQRQTFGTSSVCDEAARRSRLARTTGKITSAEVPDAGPPPRMRHPVPEGAPAVQPLLRGQPWTGVEVRLLRETMNIAIEDAAARIGVPAGLWALWEQQATRAVPPPAIRTRLINQLLLLELAARERFFTAAATHRPRRSAEQETPSPDVTSVVTWTGREIRVLRHALRMTLLEFAVHLGVSDRIVSKWEAAQDRIRPRPVNQAALDTCLRRADDDAQTRFWFGLASLADQS